MTLFIATTDGTTTFMPTDVQVDLISISLMDSELGFTETPTTAIEGVTTMAVTYSQTQVGATADRVNALVNNVGFTVPPNIVLFGVDSTFVLSDGTPLKGNGIAIPVGGSGNPFTANVAAMYDVTLCGGAGVWVDKEGGGTTQNTTDVVLFHELSHCFHFVTGTTAATSALEEVAAETDENLMRDVRGLPHRDVNSHNGGCGGGTPSCCVIASLSTGSPYSAEVAEFRHYREHVLRGSEVGDDFFRVLHLHYYAFSPEVVRLMGRTPGLGPEVRGRYVVPLLAAVELLIGYADRGGRELSSLVSDQLARPECAEFFAPDHVRSIRDAIDAVGRGELPSALMDPVAGQPVSHETLIELATLVYRGADADGLLRWALVDPLHIWSTAVLALADRQEDAAVEVLLRDRMADWLGALPITGVWGGLTRPQVVAELAHLDQFMVDPRSRRQFADRLTGEHPAYAGLAAEWSRHERVSATGDNHA